MSAKVKFIETIVDNLKKKGLAESSIKLYVRNLQKLSPTSGFSNFNFLKKTEDILNKIKDLKDNTKRQYFITIVSVLNSFGDKYRKLANTYYKHMTDIVTKIKEVPTDVKSKAQSENWISQEAVEDVQKELEKESVPLFKKKSLSEEQYNKLLQYVVLSLYVLIPPRRNLDWTKMDVCFNGDCSDKSHNYLDLKNKKFHFNIYKTAKEYGETVQDIPQPLLDVLVKFLKFNPVKEGKKTIPLLVYYTGKTLDNSNSITRILNKVFGRKISSSMLRHIYLSYKYGDEVKEREKDAKEMGHSVRTQGDYIKEI